MMKVYVLLMENGKMHSVWSSPYQLLTELDRIKPEALDEDTWQVAVGDIDVWGMPRHESVEYVRSTQGVEP